MKRFFYTLVAMSFTVGMAQADGKKGGGSSGGNAKTISNSTVGKSVSNKVLDAKVTTKIGDLSNKTQVIDKNIGVVNKGIGKVQIDKNLVKGVGNGNQVLNNKVVLQGNKNIAKLPGFKSNQQQHVQFCGKFGVPQALHNHCFFHVDFCWNHTCWFPSHNCCGYWHPYQCCWYYYHPTWCCYVPYTYIETYRPVVAVAEQTPVVVNVTNTNTNVNSETPDPLSVMPSLPPGASSNLPAGVNPNIPAPKQ